MFRPVVFALALPSATAGCIEDAAAVARDVAAVGLAGKGIAKNCKGYNRTNCEEGVGKLVDGVSTAIADVDNLGTSCATADAKCAAQIKKMSTAVKTIEEPAKQMADVCAGKHLDNIECLKNGMKVAAGVAVFAKDGAVLKSVCKKEAIAEDIVVVATNDWPSKHKNGTVACQVCETAATAVVGKGAAVCASHCAAAVAATGPISAAIAAAVCGEICHLIEKGFCEHIVQDDCAHKICQEVHLCPKNLTQDMASESSIVV